MKTKEKILKAALKHFGKTTFHDVSVEEITKTAKVNVSAISYYFGGKENLYKEVIKYLTQDVIDKLSDLNLKDIQTLDVENYKNLVKNIIQVFYGLFTSANGIYRVNIYIREVSSPTNPEIKELFNTHIMFSYDLLRKILHTFYLDKLNKNNVNIDFKITVLFSMLKEFSLNSQKPTHLQNLYNNNLFQELEKFILE